MHDSAALLKSYQLKVTPQRIAIVDALFTSGHMSIDELYQRLIADFPTASLATVYKNINAMIERAFVWEVKLPDQKSKYELAKEKHAHVVCDCCGKVEDILLDTSKIVEQAGNLTHYTIRRDDLIFSGTCPACLEKSA